VQKPAGKVTAKPVSRSAKKAEPAKAAKLAGKTTARRTEAVVKTSTGAKSKPEMAATSVENGVSNIDAHTQQTFASGEKIMNDQVKQFTDLQAKALEPMRVFSALAVETMEQVVRKNYQVMGDIVDYSVKQAQLPAQDENVSDVAQAKMAESTAFTELLGSRANEYLELGNQFSQKAREATEAAVASAKAA